MYATSSLSPEQLRAYLEALEDSSFEARERKLDELGLACYGGEQRPPLERYNTYLESKLRLNHIKEQQGTLTHEQELALDDALRAMEVMEERVRRMGTDAFGRSLTEIPGAERATSFRALSKLHLELLRQSRASWTQY